MFVPCVVGELLCVLSSLAVIFIGKIERELVALLCLSSYCLVTVIVLWLFLTVSSIGLQSVIMVFPNHDHLLFYTNVM